MLVGEVQGVEIAAVGWIVRAGIVVEQTRQNIRWSGTGIVGETQREIGAKVGLAGDRRERAVREVRIGIVTRIHVVEEIGQPGPGEIEKSGKRHGNFEMDIQRRRILRIGLH